MATIHTSVKQQLISEGRRVFAESRMEFYRRHKEAPLFDDMEKAIAKHDPLDPATLKRVLAMKNARVAELIREFEGKVGELEEPNGTGYDQGNKECVDARCMASTLWGHIERKIIHERTAAAGVRRGHVFEVLGDLGVGFVITHSSCGGEDVAHQYHMGKIQDDGSPEFEQIRHLAEVIPPRDVDGHPLALEEDPVKRCVSNANHQTKTAVRILTTLDLGNPVYPLIYNWQQWPKVNVEWHSTSQKREHPLVKKMRAGAQVLWGMAHELGRSPNTQYAHAIYCYDPYRLGRFADPRVFLDDLPNQAFAVTENFQAVKDGKGLSPTAVASLRYAGFMGGGHVAGVGGKNGNHLVIIIDPDPEVTVKVEQALLESAADIRDLTKNGETIVRAKYDPATRLITFLD